jgi:hypothetical protein
MHGEAEENHNGEYLVNKVTHVMVDSRQRAEEAGNNIYPSRHAPPLQWPSFPQLGLTI